MSVTTSARMNQETLDALLPAGYEWTGGRLQDPGEKKITAAGGVSDQALQAAVATAMGQFVDRDENRASLFAAARAALADNKAFLAIAQPTAAQNAAEIKALARQVNALIRLAIDEVTETT